jgi:hypothetical protein
LNLLFAGRAASLPRRWTGGGAKRQVRRTEQGFVRSGTGSKPRRDARRGRSRRPAREGRTARLASVSRPRHQLGSGRCGSAKAPPRIGLADDPAREQSVVPRASPGHPSKRAPLGAPFGLGPWLQPTVRRRRLQRPLGASVVRRAGCPNAARPESLNRQRPVLRPARGAWQADPQFPTKFGRDCSVLRGGWAIGRAGCLAGWERVAIRA